MSAALISATAVWLGSWMRGATAPDDLLEALALAAPDAPAVVQINGAPSTPITDVLRLIRVADADCAWLLLPRAGRTIGWPPRVPGAPRPGVLVGRGDHGVGLLSHGASGWRWEATDAAVAAALKADMLTARSGARALASAVTASAQRLEHLGLERAATTSATRTWEDAMARLPRGTDREVEALLARIGGLHDALDLALADDGAAVTAGEARARATALSAVLGAVEDVLAGIVGGLNAPALAPGREHAGGAQRSEVLGRPRSQP